MGRGYGAPTSATGGVVVLLLDEQARLALGRLAAEQLDGEYEAEHGPIPDEVIARVDAFLDGPGPVRMGPDERRRTG